LLLAFVIANYKAIAVPSPRFEPGNGKPGLPNIAKEHFLLMFPDFFSSDLFARAKFDERISAMKK
jgi:hypothetical protein